MASPTLAVAGAISFIVGISFLLVARAVASRRALDDRVLARNAHAAWWLGLATYLIIQGALTMAAAFDRLSEELYLGTRILIIPMLCAATWGITFYLAYLYSGSTKTARPLALAYAAVAALFYYATYSIPQRVAAETWIVTLDDSHPLYRIVYALVGSPPIIASIAYLALLRRVREPEKRYRILLTAGAILLYVGTGLVARLSASDVTIFLTLVPLGVAAAASSLLAYYPPAFVRRRLREG